MIPKTYRCSYCNKEYEVFQEKAVGYKCPICGKDCAWLAALGTKSGDQKEFWSLELGMLGEQQREYKKLHPDAEFNKYGALKVKGYQGVKKILKERGMVELSESKEYRYQVNAEREEALEMSKDEKKK